MTTTFAGLILFFTTYRVIRRLITMHCNKATLEASNEALTKQAAANVKNADMVAKLEKKGKVGIFIACILSSNS